jgi:hypothetical protein
MNYRNYIPTERELKSLRILLDEKATQIQQLRQQIAILEAEYNELGGVLHPIRRCPSDVLKVIFEWTALFSAIEHPTSLEISNDDWFEAATRLSHVCQRWRTIALDTPKLWSKIPGFSLYPIGSDNLFWERTISRVRGYPAEVSLSGFEELSGIQNATEAYRSCRFHELPHIRILEFELDSDDSKQHLFHPLFRKPQGVVDELKITGGFRANINFEEVLIPALLRDLPSLERLSLSDLGFSSSKIVSFGGITSLKLQYVTLNNDLGQLSRQFPNLRRLFLQVYDDILVSNSTCHFPALEELNIIEMTSVDEFLTALDCPNLVKFHFHLFTNDEFKDFVVRYSKMSRLLVMEWDTGFKALADIAPDIIELTHGYQSSMFTEDSDEMGPLVFHELACYTLVDLDNELTIDEFERMVMRYALPHEHERSQLYDGGEHLQTLTIGISSDEPSDAKWFNSPLYKQAKEIRFERDSEFPDMLFIAMSW